MSHMLIYVTASSIERARVLAHDLVSARLIACANIMPGMVSIYEWQGQVTEANEVVMICKTRADLAPAVVAAIEARHDYDCPCVLAMPVTGGSAAFLQWIDQQTIGAVL